MAIIAELLIYFNKLVPVLSYILMKYHVKTYN